MRKYFIGKVFVLEAAPPDETMSVEIGVGLQNENTPAALLLELDDEDLAPISRQRVLDIERESPLSMETLRLNRHVPLDRQYRSEEHTSELQSLLRISYAVFCLKKKHLHTE